MRSDTAPAANLVSVANGMACLSEYSPSWCGLMEVDKGVIAAYLIGGFLCGDVLRGLLGRKAASPPGIAIAVGLGAALLAFWAVRMYRRAAVQPNPEFPVAASTRYARPVTATICFFVGMLVVFL